MNSTNITLERVEELKEWTDLLPSEIREDVDAILDEKATQIKAGGIRVKYTTACPRCGLPLGEHEATIGPGEMPERDVSRKREGSNGESKSRPMAETCEKDIRLTGEDATQVQGQVRRSPSPDSPGPSDITTAQMLDEVDDEICGLECAMGMCELGSPERDHQAGILAVFKAIRSRLTEYDALRAEVERLNADYKWLSKTNVDIVEKREKAEAELAAARPLLEAVMKTGRWPDELSDSELHRIEPAALAYRRAKEGK